LKLTDTSTDDFLAQRKRESQIYVTASAISLSAFFTLLGQQQFIKNDCQRFSRISDK
jgi:hypothetical protein